VPTTVRVLTVFQTVKVVVVVVDAQNFDTVFVADAVIVFAVDESVSIVIFLIGTFFDFWSGRGDVRGDLYVLCDLGIGLRGLLDISRDVGESLGISTWEQAVSIIDGNTCQALRLGFLCSHARWAVSGQGVCAFVTCEKSAWEQNKEKIEFQGRDFHWFQHDFSSEQLPYSITNDPGLDTIWQSAL